MGVKDLPATRAEPGGSAVSAAWGWAASAESAHAARPEFRGDGAGAFASALAVRAEFRLVSDAPLYARGDVEKPGEKVPRGFLSLLTHSTPPSHSRAAAAAACNSPNG